jgi:hypothetical protein
MDNQPAYRTQTDYPAALEAQKRAFEAWKPFRTGKAVMFFPTFTDPNDIPDAPECAIVVGSLDFEPGMFWVHNEDQADQVLMKMRDGTWPRMLGIIHAITSATEHEFTKIVAAIDPESGVEWCSVAAKDHGWSLELQVQEMKRQFPTALVEIFDVTNYSRN